jgi:peptidoglycan/LPS O-acetylase OafA/YrhL
MSLRHNNFDLLRLAFAGAVLLWHQSVVSQAPALEVLGRLASPDLGVKGFFVVSGYLVVMSCERSASLRDYAAKRIRRIYPAYATVVFLAFVAGWAASPVGSAEYLRGGARYLLANLAFLNFVAPTLPGVFASNPWTEVNGALWTLKIEVMFYALVPFLVLAARRLGALPVLGALYILSVAYLVTLEAVAASTGRQLWLQLQRQLPGQLTYFLVGAALYMYRERVERRWGVLLAIAAAAYLAQVLVPALPVKAAFEPLALGIAVVFAACGLRYLGNFARFGDLSYGIYIIHFAVIQTAVAAGLYAQDPWLAFTATTAVTVALAFICWHAVEKPFLSRRSHYRLAESAKADRRAIVSAGSAAGSPRGSAHSEARAGWRGAPRARPRREDRR